MRISTPPAKLASEPCKARPTARPAAPSTAINEVVSIPIIPATVIRTIALKPAPVRLIRKFLSVSSIPPLLSAAPMPRVTIPTIHQPTIKVTKAPSKDGL